MMEDAKMPEDPTEVAQFNFTRSITLILIFQKMISVDTEINSNTDCFVSDLA